MSDDNVTLPEEPDGSAGAGEPVGADGDPAPEPAPEPPAPPTCAECGAELEEGQPYCLECGAPTRWAPSLRRRIGPAAVLALGLLALGGGAGALAYAIAKDDEDGTAQGSTAFTVPTETTFPTTFGTTPSVDLTDTSGLPPFPGTTTGTFPSTDFTTTDPGLTDTTTDPGFTDPSTDTTFTETDPGTTVETDPPTSGGADTWPDGTDGWTVILASTSDQAAASAFRDQVAATGRQAGLIESDLYSTLQPGLWVVYSGVYTTRDQALSSAASLRATYPGAYAARVAA